MAERTRERPPGGRGPISNTDHGTGRRTPIISRPTLGKHFPRPDLWRKYTDPTVYLTRPTMFGLTFTEYVNERRRREHEGWSRIELDARFPDPRAEAAS